MSALFDGTVKGESGQISYPTLERLSLAFSNYSCPVLSAKWRCFIFCVMVAAKGTVRTNDDVLQSSEDIYILLLSTVILC